MDQVKIGKFIADCRKRKNLTQMQLAEKLNITDRAVSKWENGRAMPDSSIMLELCSILNITVNELLNGEEIKMEKCNEKLDEILLDYIRKKEESDRKMLRLEIFIGIISVITLLTLIIISSLINMQTWIRILLVSIGIIIFSISIFVALSIEQTAGYYECQKCHHRYVPKYKNVFFSAHINRSRYMKCPKCGKRSLQKKVISK